MTIQRKRSCLIMTRKYKKISLRLDSSKNVRATLSRISNMVVNGELDNKTANTIILACNAILNALRTDEQQKKIDELERLLKELNLK